MRPFFNWRSYASAIPGREDCGPCLGGTGHDMPTEVFRASMSYVTGSHNFKVGVNGRWATEQHTQSRLASNAWPIRLLFFGLNPATGVPVPNLGGGLVGYVSQYATPKASLQESLDLGFYAQDQWTIDRLTLNLGVRYDRITGWVPAQTAPTGRWTARNADGTPLSTERIDNLPNFQDITPRLGVSYDLRGDGRTALKASLGKYVVPVGSAIAEAINPLENVRSFTNRLWFDLNRNLIPDCDLDNFGDQTGFLTRPGAPTGGECGPILHPQFGTATRTLSFDPDVLEGWGKRQYQWQTSVSIQHELTDNWSIEAGYFRTQYGNFLVGDDLNVTPADFLEFSIAAPPGSEALGLTPGERITGLYTKSAEALARPENFLVQPASVHGDMFQRYNGFDVNFDGRFDNGLTVGGGLSTGVRSFNECFVVDSPMRARDGFCEQSEPWGPLTQFKVNGSVPLPYDTQVSFVFQSLGGQPWISQYRAGGAAVRPGHDQRPARRDSERHGDHPVVAVRAGRQQPEHQQPQQGAVRDAVLLPGVRPVRAPAEPARPAVREDLQRRQRAHPRLGRPVQRVQREQCHEHRLLVQPAELPGGHRGDGRAHAEVRRPVRLLAIDGGYAPKPPGRPWRGPFAPRRACRGPLCGPWDDTNCSCRPCLLSRGVIPEGGACGLRPLYVQRLRAPSTPLGLATAPALTAYRGCARGGG